MNLLGHAKNQRALIYECKKIKNKTSKYENKNNYLKSWSGLKGLDFYTNQKKRKKKMKLAVEIISLRNNLSQKIKKKRSWNSRLDLINVSILK